MKTFLFPTLLVSALLAVPAQAADKGAETKSATTMKIPTYVSYHVIVRADDLRKSIGDLIGSLNDAGATFGYGDWKKEQSTLSALKTKLNKVGNTLELKKERTDNDTWSAFVYSPTYTTTVYGSLKNMGQILSQIASGMKGAEKTTAKTPIRVADDVVRQVNDVRADVTNLVDSIESGGRGFTHFDWSRNGKDLAGFRQRLHRVEVKLDHKENSADGQWVAWFGADVYKVTVHDSVAELGSIIEELAMAMSGTSSNAAH